uniref:Ion transport domain-containing protein n=1 Tax=Parascaris univalens TaxID=6257 RepID=A0A915A642_PARUN
MGNASSTVTAGIKSQVDNRNNVIYKLGDVTGNGELALLAKDTLRTKNVALLDQRIIERIRPLLYNDGEGKMIPIEKIIAQRHMERTGNTYAVQGNGLKKFVCWHLNHRGAVGETLLHVCFLSGLPDHMKLLAQRLLYNFPKIINDFYLCDEYYGICISVNILFRLLHAFHKVNAFECLLLMELIPIGKILTETQCFILQQFMRNGQMKQMFEKIVEEERQVYWTYGGVMSAAYPLEHLDSIEPSTGRLNRNSALAIVVYGNSAEHLNLLPNLLEQLVQKKWITLFGQLATFFLYFATVFWCFLLRPTPFERHMNSTDLYCLAEVHKVNLRAVNTRTHVTFYVIFLGFLEVTPVHIHEVDTVMWNVPESLYGCFLMSLTEFTVLFDQLEECDLAVVGKIAFIVYLLLVTILLINMLIAMMTNTYTEVSANSLEWLRQWSAIILMMEQSFDPATRLKYQAIYSIPMEDRKRIALLLKLRFPIGVEWEMGRDVFNIQSSHLLST